MAKEFVLAIDQGTTSTRAVLLRADLTIVATAHEEFPQHFPASGWVEHDPEDLWSTTLSTCRRVIAQAGCLADDIAAIGITNQRETTLVWDRHTGVPVYRAIVWQDRRTAKLCTKLERAGHERLFARRTGLRLDPYFSGTKVAWILDNVKGARQRAREGALVFGTVDCFLLWRLTGGAVHATDATNASRTLMYNIHSGDWDDELLALLKVPRAMLPKVEDCVADFGRTAADLFGASIPVRGVAGDQQAAAIGQACFEPGMIKATFGTGCFALVNTGKQAVVSKNRLLTTIAYRLEGKTTYALEGSIFVAGAAIQWLRDGLKIIERAQDATELARAADPTQSVILVPAFVGLGAPYWDADCRGALFGLTRATTRRELARAALESVCFQMRDLVEAMRRDWREPAGKTVLRVDGGMVASDYMLQFLADMLAAPVDRPAILETTVLGAAYLAGFAAGLYPAPAVFASAWRLDRRFDPSLQSHLREARYAAWKDAVSRTLTVRKGRR
jgi:glycerol kinase